MCNVEQCAGIEKEFDDLHIFRHIAAVQVPHIVEGYTAAEQALDHGLQKQPLQLAVPLRRAQAQGREHLERNGRVAPCAAVKLIDQRIRLANPQWQCQHDARSNAA